jgi:hypothetical protein
LSNLNIVTKYYTKIHTYVPAGTSASGGGRWYPSVDEMCSCCKDIRSPSRAYPSSLWNHCKSGKHIWNLIQKNPFFIGVDVPEALKMTKESAPLYINSESNLLKYVRDELLGIHKESNPNKGVKHANKT